MKYQIKDKKIDDKYLTIIDTAFLITDFIDGSKDDEYEYIVETLVNARNQIKHNPQLIYEFISDMIADIAEYLYDNNLCPKCGKEMIVKDEGRKYCDNCKITF